MRFSVRVTEVIRHSADVASYRLRASRRLPRFRPGQFVQITIDHYDPSGFWPDSRPFSVANCVMDRRELRITVSRQGEYTSRILDEVSEGSELWAKGPYGDFVVGGRDSLPAAVLLAGGTGVTPFCAFMDRALDEGMIPLRSVRLYYGAKTTDLLIYRELAERCAARFPQFSATLYAEEGRSEDSPTIRPGLLNLADVFSDLSAPSETSFYISGPMGMIDSFRRSLLNEPAVTADQILLDSWE